MTPTPVVAITVPTPEFCPTCHKGAVEVTSKRTDLGPGRYTDEWKAQCEKGHQWPVTSVRSEPWSPK